jgi:hypothetical protein
MCPSLLPLWKGFRCARFLAVLFTKAISTLVARVASPWILHTDFTWVLIFWLIAGAACRAVADAVRASLGPRGLKVYIFLLSISLVSEADVGPGPP